MDWVEHDRSISTGDEEDDDDDGDDEENLGAMTDENLEDLDEEIEDEFEREFVQYVFFVFLFFLFSFLFLLVFIQSSVFNSNEQLLMSVSAFLAEHLQRSLCN